MKALLTSDFRRRESDTDQFSALSGSPWGGEVRTFSQTSGLILFPPDSESCGSVYVRDGSAQFDEVLVGRSVRLFQSPWGRAFLRHAMSRLEASDSSRIHLHTVGNKASVKNQMWSPEAASAFFGREADIVHGKQQAASFRWRQLEPKMESVLDWYLTSAMSLVVFDVLLRASPDVAHFERSDDRCLEFLYDSAERIVGGSRKRLAGEPSGNEVEGRVPWQEGGNQVPVEAELSRALKAQSYYVGGIAYKQPILKHIIKTCCHSDRPLRLADFGGGYGLLAAETVLDDDLDVEHAVCRDYSPANFVFAAQLYRGMREQLKDRFYFSVGKSEEFEFKGDYDVICFVGSLLYTPQEMRAAALQRCWERLRAGGILVIHENIKHPSYKADFERMFTRDEIDELLGRFGPIRRFMSTTIQECTRDEAEEKSVFRVVTKV